MAVWDSNADKAKPLEPKQPGSGNDWENIDTYISQTKYDYLGPVPIVDDKLLNHTVFKDVKIDESKYSKNDSTKMRQLIYLYWQRAMQVKCENWIYEGFPRGLDHYKLEMPMLTYGQVAVFKKFGKYYASNFTSEKLDIYNNPISIRLTNKDVEDFNDIVLTKFVIFKDTADGLPLLNKIVRYVTNMIDCLIAIQRNLTSSMPHGVILNPWKVQNGKEIIDPIAEALKQTLNSFEPIVPINIPDTYFQQLNKSLSDVKVRVSDLYLDVSLANLIKEYIMTYNFWENQLKIELGLPVDNELKPENRIQDEVQVQQGLNNNVLYHGKHIRENACEQMNEVFGVNMSVKLRKEIEQEKEINEGDSNGDENTFSN